jgi:hypothetical protein
MKPARDSIESCSQRTPGAAFFQLQGDLIRHEIGLENVVLSVVRREAVAADRAVNGSSSPAMGEAHTSMKND